MPGTVPFQVRWMRRPGPVPIRLRASDGGERDVVLHPAVVVP
jgi:hypothetical protein